MHPCTALSEWGMTTLTRVGTLKLAHLIYISRPDMHHACVVQQSALTHTFSTDESQVSVFLIRQFDTSGACPLQSFSHQKHTGLNMSVNILLAFTSSMLVHSLIISLASTMWGHSNTSTSSASTVWVVQTQHYVAVPLISPCAQMLANAGSDAIICFLCNSYIGARGAK